MLAAVLLLALPLMPAHGQVSRPAEATYAVTGVAGNDVLNIRDRADGNKIIGHIPPDGRGILMLGPRAKVSGANWARVQYEDVSGWVNARFLAAEPPRKVESATRSVPVATAALTPQVMAEPDGRRIALVIGNGAYSPDSGLARLEMARNDGQDMTAALRELGFDVVSLIDADLQQSRDGLAQFAVRARDAAVAFVYFSGHSVQLNGENFLLPVSAAPEDADTLARQALPLFALTETVHVAQPGLGLVIIDASRASGRLPKLAEHPGAEVGRGLARIKSASGSMLVFSAEPDTTVADGTGRNSPFTAALLKEIRTPGVDVRDTFQSVREAVLGDTRGAQSPWIDDAVVGKHALNPGSSMRAERFYGAWSHNDWALEIGPDRISISEAKRPQRTRDVAAGSKQCGDLYERNFAVVAVDDLPNIFTDRRFVEWSRSATQLKSLMVMVVTCGQASHRFFFLLTDQQRMLMAEWSERDWLMYQELARGAQRVGTR